MTQYGNTRSGRAAPRPLSGLPRDRRDDAAAAHATERGKGPILGDEQRAVARKCQGSGPDADACCPNPVSLARDPARSGYRPPASIRADQEHPATAAGPDGDIETSRRWEHCRSVNPGDLVQFAARMIDPDHPAPRVGYPEVTTRVVAQAMWAVNALTDGHEGLERSRVQIQAHDATLDRGDREVPAGRVEVDPDGAWDMRHGRDPASWCEAPYDTVVDVRDVQLSGAVFGERGDLPELCTQGRPAVSAGSTPAVACDSDEVVMLRVVSQHPMTPCVRNQDTAPMVDEQPVGKREAHWLRARQCNRDENQREEE